VVNEQKMEERQRVIELASEYGRYGYRQVTDMMRNDGHIINHKRVERIWRQEGLKVPSKQPKRSRLLLNDGSCVRLRAAHVDHVWSYDFMFDRTHDDRLFKVLNILDEYSRECLRIQIGRQLNSTDVLEALAELFVLRGVPQFIRSDNGAEFTAELVRHWLSELNVGTLFIEPGSPWENVYIESFNARFRYELLDAELFYTVREAQVLAEMWRQHYNRVRPHSSLGGKPPAPEAFLPLGWTKGRTESTMETTVGLTH
jgi:putative transposase